MYNRRRSVEGLVSVLIGLLHLGRCLGVGIVVGLSEGGIVVEGGNVVVVGGVLAGGSGLGEVWVVLIGLLHLGRCLGVGIVVGLSEGGIVVEGGNVVVKALGGKVNVVVCMCGNVVVGGIVMAVGGGNVAVSLGLGGTVVVNVIDVVCPFCLCCVLAGVVDPDLLLGSLRSLTKLTSFPCETFTIASKMDLANFS